MKDFIIEFPSVTIAKEKSNTHTKLFNLESEIKERENLSRNPDEKSEGVNKKEGVNLDKPIKEQNKEVFYPISSEDIATTILPQEDGRIFILIRELKDGALSKDLYDLVIWDSDSKEKPEGCPAIEWLDVKES